MHHPNLGTCADSFIETDLYLYHTLGAMAYSSYPFSVHPLCHRRPSTATFEPVVPSTDHHTLVFNRVVTVMEKTRERHLTEANEDLYRHAAINTWRRENVDNTQLLLVRPDLTVLWDVSLGDDRLELQIVPVLLRWVHAKELLNKLTTIVSYHSPVDAPEKQKSGNTSSYKLPNMPTLQECGEKWGIVTRGKKL